MTLNDDLRVLKFLFMHVHDSQETWFKHVEPQALLKISFQQAIMTKFAICNILPLLVISLVHNKHPHLIVGVLYFYNRDWVNNDL